MRTVRDDVEAEIGTRCRAAREKLEARAGLAGPPITHFRRPFERPFTADERSRVTILFGGLTERHERLCQAVFESSGYNARPLPQPDVASCLVGREYCDNGVCNPAYFTIGSLVRFLQQLEASGMSRRDIVDRYVFLTAGSCGPCRFGMYESQYRIALRNAGFDGFRVLLFQQEDGVRAQTGEPGLKLTVAFGLGAFDALTFGDALQGFGYGVRPYEVQTGATDRCLDEATGIVASAVRSRRPVRAEEQLPRLLWRVLQRRSGLAGKINVVLNIREHVAGELTARTIDACREVLSQIEVDRLRLRPVVKVTGEFWAQTTEGDGNFRMFSFLEQQGAHALVEPLSGWVTYLLQYARERALRDRGLELRDEGTLWSRARARWADDSRTAKRWLLVEIGEQILERRHRRLLEAFGGAGQALVDQRLLASLADPYYRSLARGGEGHLEVAKNLYYTTRGAAHMVLSLKPFGCMPSTQSDGVQSALVTRFADMLYVPVETAADGELAAQSRVEIALVHARARAEAEFERALASTRRTLEEIQAFVADHPEIRRATYPVPHHRHVAGVAANFVLHVDRLMAGRFRPRWRRTPVGVPPVREVSP